MTESSASRALSDWLSHLETLHPKAIDLGLDRIRAVALRLGVIPASRRTLTVAGTNGKGTCVHTLQTLLLGAGFSVGVYTSPHLLRFNERIAINGEAVSDSRILDAFTAIEEARGDITLSYFEFATLAALWLFREASTDWQILEVGLGGRLDAVNIVDADACVITSIGIDHTEWLGDTREDIAPEKAGVAREGKPAVVAEEDLPSSLLPALAEIGAQALTLNQAWALAGNDLTLPSGATLTLPALPGLQPSNVAAALVVLEACDVAVDQALIDRSLTGMTVPGRQQRLAFAGRDWWFDVSHNRESVAALVAALEADPCPGRVFAVFGAMADKPLRDMISAIQPHVDEWHLPACPELPRAAAPSLIHGLLGTAPAIEYDNAESAWCGVLAASQPGDRIIVFGSFITVGAQLALLQNCHQTSGRETES